MGRGTGRAVGELRRAPADYSGISYRSIEERDGVFWPCPDGSPAAGTPRLFLDRFATEDGRARFTPVSHRDAAELPDADYPLLLTTGRVVAQYQSGAQTRRVEELNAAAPGAFVELHPDEPPVRDVLTRFLDAAELPDDPRAALLAGLNDAIQDTDRDFKIGPSYLMRPEAATDAGLDRIWRHDILPLLEEHYYGRISRSEIRERFGLNALRRSAQRNPAAAETIDGGVGGALTEDS